MSSGLLVSRKLFMHPCLGAFDLDQFKKLRNYTCSDRLDGDDTLPETHYNVWCRSLVL